jgi:hypothetical protein
MLMNKYRQIFEPYLRQLPEEERIPWLAKKKTEASEEDLVWIYLLWERRSNLVKIGFTKDLEQRRTSIFYDEKAKGHCEPELQYLFAFKHVKQMECMLHDFAAHRRVRGEWFKLHLPDLMYLMLFASGHEMKMGKNLSYCFQLQNLKEADNV